MSRTGLGIVIAAALVFVAGVLALAVVAARQDTRVLTTYTGSPPVGPPRPAHGASDTSDDNSADATRPQTGWVRQVAERTGLPARALYAYARTDLVLHVEAPACKLSWATLAGVGRVESAHGGFGGATLDRAGRPTKPIFGAALDGSSGVQQVADTDRGVLDGDTRYDRAVGPM
jgi:membrane-bound lytic murein transglycosylase B